MATWYPLKRKRKNNMLIQIKNLSKIYKLGEIEVKALLDVDLDINKNEYVAIMGPSGSGKSTLMNILGCLDVLSEGSYVLNDQDVSNLSDDQLAEIRNKEIGFIFQTFNLLPRANASHNVELPLIYSGTSRIKRKELAQVALDKVGLADRATHKPNELSGGQRQRVAIARALINNPSIVLADEPTGNLDSKTGLEIMKILQNLHRAGNTIIVVTHEEEIARQCERIIRLFDGRIVSDKRVN